MLITLRLLYQRRAPMQLPEAWTNLMQDVHFYEGVEEVRADISRIQQVCHAIFALQYAKVEAVDPSLLYTYPINNIVIDLELVGVPEPVRMPFLQCSSLLIEYSRPDSNGASPLVASGVFTGSLWRTTVTSWRAAISTWPRTPCSTDRSTALINE